MRLLLVEDDKKISAFVAKGLREAGFAVDESDNGEDGFHLAATEPYDAAVVDIMLPRMDGLTFIESLRSQNINIPVLILSAKRSLDDRLRGLEVGGDDYLGKPFAFSELLARVQALIRRSSRAPESTRLAVEDLELNLLNREVKRGERRIELQAREFALLEFLMRNSSRAVSRTMILEHVFEYRHDPETNVVDVLVCRLRNKIEEAGESKLIHTVRGVGYVLKAEVAFAKEP